MLFDDFVTRGSTDDTEREYVRKYLGTVDGVLRVFPGIVMPKEYDHTKTTW